jgi:glucose-1-phosphate cytidylyltransferase
LITISAVRLIARFGELIIKKNIVNKFSEKPQITTGWINGGFFIAKPEMFRFIKNKNTVFEEQPLELLSKKKQFIAYLHKGFWQCLDTLTDLNSLNLLWKQRKHIGKFGN